MIRNPAAMLIELMIIRVMCFTLIRYFALRNLAKLLKMIRDLDIRNQQERHSQLKERHQILLAEALGQVA